MNFFQVFGPQCSAGQLRLWKFQVRQPDIYLHWIFAKFQFDSSSLMNLIFSIFQTWILQTTASRKMQSKLGNKSSSSNSIFQTGELQDGKEQIKRFL